MSIRFNNFSEHELILGLWYGEARKVENCAMDETKEYLSIGNVVLNRVYLPNFPDTVKDVILQPKQFSCFNPSDPNCGAVYDFLVQADLKEKKLYDRMKPYAEALVNGRIRDFSEGSDHYVAKWFYENCDEDHWCRRCEIRACYGGHIFLKEV